MPWETCILSEFAGGLLSQGMKGERLGFQTSSYVNFVYNAIPVELPGSGMGWRQVGCRGSSGSSGFAVDLRTENPEQRWELARGHWDKPHFLGHAVGTSHSDHGRASDKLSSDCVKDKIETGGIMRVQGTES